MTLQQLIQLQVDRLRQALSVLEKLPPDIPAGTSEAEQYQKNIDDGKRSLAARERFLEQLGYAERAVSRVENHESVVTIAQLKGIYKSLFMIQDNPLTKQYIPTKPKQKHQLVTSKVLAELKELLNKQYEDDYFQAP